MSLMWVRLRVQSRCRLTTAIDVCSHYQPAPRGIRGGDRQMASKTTVVTDTMTEKTDPKNFTAYRIHRGSHAPEAFPPTRCTEELFGFWSRKKFGKLPARILVIEHVFPPYDPVTRADRDGYSGPTIEFLVDGVYYVRQGNTFRGYKTPAVS